MEAHHEVVAYIACADTERVVDALVALCERAGLLRFPEAPVPVLGTPPSRDGLKMPAFPVDWIGDSEALVCDIAEAITCSHLAQRLGGPSTGRYWREGWPWRLVEDAVRLGDAMPVAGGVILGFGPVEAELTACDGVPAVPPTDNAMDDLVRRAAHGDADAQYEVGMIHRKLPAGPPYLEIREVGQRQLRAATWFRRAAEQGHAAAQFWLGRAHYMNEGASKDWSEALLWLQRATAQGQRDAMAWLAEPVGGREPRLEMMRGVLGLAHDPADVAALRAQLNEPDRS